MKGINIQFDNLVNLLQKNINNKQLVKSKENFELVYQKITQQTFKTVNLIFDNLLEDFSIKQSFSKLLKQLKTFLTLKPVTLQDDQDDYFNRQFDQVKQFMNNRKPVMTELDTSQRGDIYKFLFQAENKEKDIQQFMGNINPLNQKGNKKFQLTNGKWKQTMKSIPITEQIEVQTELSMQFLQKLEKRFPSLFKPVKSMTADSEIDKLNGSSNRPEATEVQDIDAKIDQILGLKPQAKNSQDNGNKALDQVDESIELKDSKDKKKDDLGQKTKKKPVQGGKRNSQANLKRISNASSNNLKAKSNFISLNNNKKQALANVEESKFELKDNTISGFTKINASEDVLSQTNRYRTGSMRKEDNKQEIDRFLGSFEKMFSSLPELESVDGVSPQQMKLIYQKIKNKLCQNLTINPLPFNFGGADPQRRENKNIDKQKANSLSKKVLTLEKQTITTISYNNSRTDNISSLNSTEGLPKNSSQLQFNTHTSYLKNKTSQNCVQCSVENETLQENFYQKNKSVKFQSELNPNQLKDFPQNTGSFQGFATKNKSIGNCQVLSKSTLPNISKLGGSEVVNKFQKSDSTKQLSKQGRSAEDYLRKLKDTKYMKGFQNDKPSNKQNYSLDMYKARKDPMNKNRVSEHVNLPSLNRSTQNRGGFASLHEDINDLGKSPYLKKSSKKYIYHESIDIDGSADRNHNLNDQHLKKLKKQKSKDVFKEEERIMKQLERISKQNSVKSNLKNIAMYVQFVQSVHLRRCGQKCIHLQRFNEFMLRNNIPNRKEFLLHKTDMNINAQI